MAAWIYQIDPKTWSPERYRLEIWERERWSWGVGRKTRFGHSPPVPGDIVSFFYAKSGGDDPGFYGWAVITEWYEGQGGTEMYFRPVAPSDSLKMDPWWDADARKLADDIRGSVKQGTLWFVSPADAARLRAGIHGWTAAERR